MQTAVHVEDGSVERELTDAFRQFVDAYASLAEIAGCHVARGADGAQRLKTLLESVVLSEDAERSDNTQNGTRRIVAAAIETISDEAESKTILSQRAIRIDHVAIAVRDLEAAIDSLGRYGFDVIERRTVSGEVSGMQSATVRAGGVTLVLCQGDSPRSNVSQYIEAYGPGVQHLAIQISGLQHVVVDFTDRGADLLTGIVQGPGLRQVFTRRHPSTGMQFEFVERVATSGFDDESVRNLFMAMEREGVF